MRLDDELPSGRIEVKGEGVGELNADLLARRAAEIAISDGRTEPGERDFAAAREELISQQRHVLPEESAGADLEGIAAGAEPEELSVSGGRAAVNPYETSYSNATRLVEEGLEEADHDQRLHGAREQNKETLDLGE